MQRTLVAVTGIALAMCLTGCHRVKIRNRQASPAIHATSDIKANPNQVRLRMRSLVDPFVGEIEQSADKIVADAASLSVKRAAIRWKIEAVPAMRGALFQPDPFTAVTDTWVFTYQMTDYFEKGPGKVALGDAAPQAADTSRRLEAEFASVAATFTKSGDISKARAFMRQWASDHPIRYAIQDRESTLSRVLDTDVGESLSLGETAAEITTTADDLHREIQIYSDHLFRQARWEAELLALDLHTEDVLPLAERAVKSSERAAGTLDDIAPAIKTAADVASTTPALVTSERKAIIDAVGTLVASERKAATDSVSEDLTRTLTFLDEERKASMRQVSEERIAAMQQVSQERISALVEIRDIAAQQRVALSRDIEQSGRRLVDHAAWLAAQIVAAILACVFLAILFFIFLIRRLILSSREPRHWTRQDLPGAA